MTRGISEMGDEFDDFCAMSGRSPPSKYGGLLSERASCKDNQTDDCLFAPELKYVPGNSPRTSPKGSTNSNSSNGSTSHHHRSASCKKVRTRARNIELEDIRPRTSSMPTKNLIRKPVKNYLTPSFPYDNEDDEDEYNRVRTFTTSSKGIKNRGDSFKRKSKSSTSVASNSSAHSGEPTVNQSPTPSGGDDDAELEARERVLSFGSTCSSSGGEPVHRVLMLGQADVGKTALVQQFMTSEYLGASVDCVYDDELTEKSVSVLLDDVESTMLFTEADDQTSLRDVCPDTYVVVYSVTDRGSFERATDILFKLRKEEHRSTAVILVGNKSDLVRLRQISLEEGKVVATTYDCKFIETSAILCHQVDELLVGTLSQIRLHEKEYGKKVRKMREQNNNNVVQKAAKRIFSKLVKPASSHSSKSCDNLLKL